MKLELKIYLLLSIICLAVILQSCCFGAKEEYLGNNLYLSEFDNVDRQILYQEKSCASSGVQIVPMTVMEIAYNSEWIIAKSENKRDKTNIRYWVIKNKYECIPDAQTVKANTFEFDDYNLFKSFLSDNSILLELEEID